MVAKPAKDRDIIVVLRAVVHSQLLRATFHQVGKAAPDWGVLVGLQQAARHKYGNRGRNVIEHGCAQCGRRFGKRLNGSEASATIESTIINRGHPRAESQRTREASAVLKGSSTYRSHGIRDNERAREAAATPKSRILNLSHRIRYG